MNWAKHAADAIIDDERELEETERRRRRNKLMLTLGALAGTVGLGAGLYAARKPIGDAINTTFTTPGTSTGLGGLLGRFATGTAAAAAPIKSVLSRLPWGGGISGLQKDISATQISADPKTLTPEAQAVARTYKTNGPLVDNLNKVLDDKELVNEVLQAHRTANNAKAMAEPIAGQPKVTPIVGPLASLPRWQRIKTQIGGALTGSGITQSQRDVHQLPEALSHLATPGRGQDLRTRLSERLGLTPDTASKGFEDVSRMLKAREAAPGQYRFLSDRYPLLSKGALGRAAIGMLAPEIASGVGGIWHGLRGE